ncbi:lambda-exonuclease family protein, partial [Mitsuokella jalaludinii]|uniref:YqaJ viral recombinase family nuclease n=1 Tax=Mitsuokella jalaludinii TaxID=187979 RepID=UPI00307A44C3
MAKMIMTVAEMADRDAWLKMRTQGIGGSDAGTIVGLNPWKSKYELWLEKTGQVVPEDISNREPVYWGNRLEDIVAQEFTRQTGKKVRRHGMVQDEAHPFLFANVDRMVAGEKAGLECKTANGFKASLWEGDEVPASYYCQCQHYMLVTGLPVWYIACLVGGQHYVYK